MHLAPSALAPIERGVIAALLQSSATWQAISPEDCASTHLQAIQLIVRAGMAEARFSCRVFSDESNETVTLLLCVSGEYEPPEVLRAVHGSLPSTWLDSDGRTKSRLNLQSEGYSQFRLNEHGVEAQEDLGTGNTKFVLDFILRRGDGEGRRRAKGRILIESREFSPRAASATATAIR